jgi:hypothetical protein
MRRPGLLLALFGLTIALAAGEAALRMTGDVVCADVPGAFVTADAALGWRQRPNLRGWARSCRGKPLPPALVATDGRGFLNPGRPIEKPPGTARILLLGGNVPQALGVPWSLSMAGMLEGRADARRGRQLEVVNGAVSSFALDQDLLLLRAEGARVAPDLVLAVLDPVVETSALSPGLIALASSRVPAKPYFDVDVDGTLLPLETPAPEPAPPAEAAGGPLAWSALYRLATGEPATVAPPQQWLPVMATPTDTPAEVEHGNRLMRAILAALRDEARRLGAPLAIVLVPPPRTLRFGEESLTDRVLTIARELDIPATSLALVFRGLPATMGSAGYVPNTTRFNADGHFVATHTIWSFLEREHLLPDGVVPVAAPAGGRVAPLTPFPGALVMALWLALPSGAVRLVLAGLAGVVVVWLVAPLPAGVRRWGMVAANLTPIALLAGWRGPAFALGIAAVLYAVAELPRAWLRRPFLVVVLAGLAAAPILWLSTLPTERSVPIRLWVGLATATALIRAFGYAVERRRRRRPPIADYLAAILFFPTLPGGPVQSTTPLARALRDAAPTTAGALGAFVAAAARGAGRVALGAAKLVVVPLFLNLVTPDVLVSSGDAVTRLRLWGWLFETTLYFWAVYSGLADVGIGLAAMCGVRVPENFRRPARAISLGALWRRTLVTVTARLRAYVGRPITRRLGAPVGLAASFVAGACWHGVSVLALYGPFGIRPGAIVGLVLWGPLQVAAIWLVDRPAATTTVGRLVGRARTQIVLALAWVPFLAFPFGTFGTVLRLYARLVGLR